MSEIGDMLRHSADDMERNPGVAQHFSSKSLRGLADRIDAEMAELPRGKDGRPIRVGETMYDEDGRAWHVRGVTIGESPIVWDDHNVHVTSDAGEWHCFKPEWLTHERPDSWECIADELDAWCDSVDVDGDACGEPRELAARIRKLAEREDKSDE